MKGKQSMFTRLRMASLLCMVLGACTAQWSSSPDRMIDIGTHSLHARILGRGAPAVVIDVGIASRSDEWYALQERLARRTTVVVYDRAGYGESEPGPFPRDSGREAAELKSLLDASSIRGPYVLVGHSLGALNLQVFAARYPGDVAGMVLLDPPPLEWLRGGKFPGLLAMAEKMTNEWQTTAERGASSADPRVRAEAAFYRAIASEHRVMTGESARQAAAIGSFGSTRLIVIASGKPNLMFGDLAEEYQRYWIEQSRAIAGKSTRGEFVLATDSSHMLHVEAADTVFASIEAAIRDSTTH
jgi:pimeloyl-ACP methyl ester carboxylesterase